MCMHKVSYICALCRAHTNTLDDEKLAITEHVYINRGNYISGALCARATN